jgi:two-component system sensor histidine kinase PilS (NtrC family)
MLAADVEGRVVLANPAAKRILGRAEALEGTHLAELLPLEGVEWPEVLQRLRLGSPVRIDGTVMGSKILLGCTVTALTHTDGTLVGLVVHFRELTEAREAARRERLRERMEAVGEMAAGIAHEIRNPLASISGSAQMLLAEAEVSTEHERLLAIIRRESQRLSDSLNQFLLQARPGVRANGPVDIAPLIGEAVALLEHSPEVQSRHRVTFSRAPGPILCVADADAITQVFWNLARNGIEAMPEGGTLHIRLKPEGRDAVLSVCDEGRGIGDEDLRRVFEPFQSRSPMGTGLGLAVVYRIVHEHGGDIVLKTAPGSGTEIEVRLPLVEAQAGEVVAC